MKRKAEAHPYRDFELGGWKQAASAYADTFERATRLFADASGLSIPIAAVLATGGAP